MKNQTKKAKHSLKELKEFWDGPKVGFDESQYKKYIEAKRNWRAKMN